MSVLLSAYALLAMTRVHAPVTVNVDLAPGSTISGEVNIKVTVVANNPVTQVEFYVGSDLRDNATSTPYMFRFDSLPEADGDLKLRFKAYTTEQETGEKTVLVHINNGIGLGAAYHVQKGVSSLSNSDWKSAVTEGRIALKIDPKSNPARIVLTRAYLGEKALDKAQKFAEDAVSQDGSNVQALNLLAAVNIELALNVVAKEGSDRKDALDSQRQALADAVKSRRKVLDDAVSAAPAPSDDASCIKYADAAIAAGRYSLAESALRGRIQNGVANVGLYKRQAYALLRLSRFKDAIDAIRSGNLLDTNDPDICAILAVAYAELDDVVNSDAELAKAQKATPPSASAQTAAAYIALKFARATGARGKPTFPLSYDDSHGKDSALTQESRANLSSVLNGLLDNLGERTETNYFAEALENKLEDYDKADRYFENAILAEPANADAFIEQGNRSIALSYRGKQDQDAKQQDYDSAETMFLTALAAEPSSAPALTGLAVVNLLEGNAEKSVTWGEAAVMADPNYAAGHAVLCSCYSALSKAEYAQSDALRQKNKDVGPTPAERQANELQARQFGSAAVKLAVKAQDEAKTAATLDARIQGYEFANPLASWRYFYAGGRSPLITPPHG